MGKKRIFTSIRQRLSTVCLIDHKDKTRCQFRIIKNAYHKTKMDREDHEMGCVGDVSIWIYSRRHSKWLLTEYQTNEAWSTESVDCREYRRGHTTSLRVQRRAGVLKDRRKRTRQANLVASLGSSPESPYLHNRAFADPKIGLICLVIPKRTLHRPSCKARGCDCRVHWGPGRVLKSRNPWCRFCSHLLRH